MTPDLQRLMQDATRLTREGDLNAAVAAIQAALHGGHHAAGAGAAARDDGMAIDVEARVVPSDPAHEGPALPPAPGTQAPQPAQPAHTAPRPSAAEAPGTFTSGRWGGAGLAGRNYKLYVPPGAGAQPLPLVVMLHGCTQDPDDFAAGTGMNTAARVQGFYVLYPEQAAKANAQRCWNWFKHSHQERDKGEPALLAGMVREVTARHAIDPARVYVAGLSAGGAMAAIVGQAYPELFAAVGVHSGLPAGAARDLPGALEAMKSGARKAPAPGRVVPTIVIHGDADGTVHPANGEQVARAAAGPGATATAQAVQTADGRSATRHVWRNPAGQVVAEHWVVHGAPHAWSGGTRQGSYTDPRGPDATAAMLSFFLERSQPQR